MFTRIVDAVADWATSLVFSPAVWLGVILSGVGVLLFGAGRMLDSRRKGDATEPRLGKAKKKAGELPPGRPARGEPAIDDDLADIEAILKKRGIS